MNASPPALATMYKKAAGDSTLTGQLHRALIRSMPGYSGYDATAASAGLRKLQSVDDEQIAAIARLRSAQMHSESACRQKLHEIVVIERRTSGTAEH